MRSFLYHLSFNHYTNIILPGSFHLWQSFIFHWVLRSAKGVMIILDHSLAYTLVLPSWMKRTHTWMPHVGNISVLLPHILIIWLGSFHGRLTCQRLEMSLMQEEVEERRPPLPGVNKHIRQCTALPLVTVRATCPSKISHVTLLGPRQFLCP